ncbi:MAG: GNAT family N-acetyltransferase [Myxococcota bacterium]
MLFRQMLVFATARLAGRRLVPDDAAALLAVYGDPEVARYVGDGQPLSPEESVRWVDVTHRNYALRGYGMFALELDETGELVGFAGLVHPGGQAEPELKYALGRPFWGRGLATEAARGLVAHGREAFGLARIIATVDPRNLASQGVLAKAGFAPAGARDDGTLVFATAP